MESVGKTHDLDKKLANQGITLLGNKVAAGQDVHIQQLKYGLNVEP